MSPNGVRDFVQGAMPRGATRLKVERWLVSQGRIARPPNVGQFVRLLNELAGDLSPTQAVQMGRHLAALLVDTYVERRLDPPPRVGPLGRYYAHPRTQVAIGSDPARQGIASSPPRARTGRRPRGPPERALPGGPRRP